MRTHVTHCLAALLALATVVPALAQDQDSDPKPRTEIKSTTTTTTTTTGPGVVVKKKVVRHTRPRRRTRVVHHRVRHTLPPGTTIIRTTIRRPAGTRVHVNLP